MDQLLQEQVARGQEQVGQHQRLADADQERPGPVEDRAGTMVLLHLHRRSFRLLDPLFLLGRAQVAHRGGSRGEAVDLREDLLHPLPQFGHVLRGAIHPLHSRPAQVEESDPDRRQHEQQHDRGGKRAVNPVAGQPADEGLQGHGHHAGQKDRQEHRPGNAQRGHHGHHDQDKFTLARFPGRDRTGLIRQCRAG